MVLTFCERRYYLLVRLHGSLEGQVGDYSEGMSSHSQQHLVAISVRQIIRPAIVGRICYLPRLCHEIKLSFFALNRQFLWTRTAASFSNFLTQVLIRFKVIVAGTQNLTHVFLPVGPLAELLLDHCKGKSKF